MPELPEVEVVRRGLAEHVVGRAVTGLDLHGVRVARRHLAGPGDLVERVVGRRVESAQRRGKYLWLVLADPAASDAPIALLCHLGMSGQMLIADPSSPDQKHLHARFTFADDGPELRFVDQRTFGGLALSDLDSTGGPSVIGHIAPDPFDPAYDAGAVVRRIKAKNSEIKRVLLDQSVVSGIGNIYADEAMWRARIHGERIASSLTKPAIAGLLEHARDVMGEALGEGGTSFDALYVNINGASGYFDRRLRAYGQEGEPCERCGTPIRRSAFMNRSSFWCPRCQPRPRTRVR